MNFTLGVPGRRRSNSGSLALAEELSPLLLQSYAEGTLKACRSSFTTFARWCRVHERTAFPADADTISLFLADVAPRYATATVRSLLSAIALVHRAAGKPFDCRDFDALMQGIRRQHSRPPRQATPLTVAEVRNILTDMPEGLRSTRDRAMVMAGFAGALRACEVVGLDVGTHGCGSTGLIAIGPTGAHIVLHKSKGDRAGKGQTKWLPRGGNPCAVEAIESWLRAADITGGPLFRPTVGRDRLRMHVEWVGQVLRRLVFQSARRSGLNETQARLRAAGYSGHSLRTGFVTSAVMAGVPNEDIAAHVGWSSTHHVFRYARRGEPLQNNPAQLVLSL
jgi:integrase